MFGQRAPEVEVVEATRALADGGIELAADELTLAERPLPAIRSCTPALSISVTRALAWNSQEMSLEDFKALEETAYLLRAPKNAKRLLEAIANLESDQGKGRRLAE